MTMTREEMQRLASYGRDGDTMLAHINPQEAALLKKSGGSGTINPDTGLPEYRFGGFLGGGLPSIKKNVTDPLVETVSNPVDTLIKTIKNLFGKTVSPIIKPVE